MSKVIAPLSSLLILAVSVLLKVNSSEWRDLFFYNGDSVTLAMALQSINEGEPFKWVFSSQNFFFPESFLYIFSYWVTGGYKNAMIFNGVLNLFLALLFFWYICINNIGIKGRGWIAVSLAALFFALFLFVEQQPDVNGKSIFTLTLFSTYYFGVILSSVLMMAIFLDGFTSGKSSSLLYVVFIVVGSFCYASDPLYLIQFAAPFSIVIVLISILRWKAFSRFCSKTIASVAMSIALGQLLRIFFKDYTVAGINSYIKFDQIISAINSLFGLVSTLPGAPLYFFLWIFWCLSMFYVGYIFFCGVFKSGVYEDTGRLLFLGFCFFSPLVNIAAVILSGNFLTRYFLTLSFFPTIGLCFLLAEKIRNEWLVYVPIVFAGLIVLPKYFKDIMSSKIMTSYEKSLSCYQSFVEEDPFHAVGSFWTSRYLDLNRTTHFRTFQTLNDFRPFNWLSNRHDYNNFIITAVVVDKALNPAHINPEDVEKLGSPTRIMSCDNFDIYKYDEGSYGYLRLNSSMRNR